MKSPVRSVHSLHASFVMEMLRPVRNELTDRASEYDTIDNSIHRSPLRKSVNDSQSGKKFVQAYFKMDLLGEGGYAAVYRCQHKYNGSHYAVKEVVHSQYDGANSLKDEITVLKSLREHVCHVVPLHDVFMEVDRTYLVMEEMLGGDLLDRLDERGRYTEAKARIVMQSLLEALRFCHLKRIAHRDVKLDNILLISKEDDTSIKLCDFGCSKIVHKPYALQTMAGTPSYAAPEIFDHSKNGGYGEECDLWSAGVVLYALLAGFVPFEGSIYEISRQVTSGDWVFEEEFFDCVSQPTKDLITNLMTIDVEQRITADAALDCEWLQRRELKDSFLTKTRECKTLELHSCCSPTCSSSTLSILNMDSPLSPHSHFKPVQMQWSFSSTLQIPF